MPPSTRYGLHFVIYHHVLDVITFEKQVTFEAYDSKKFRRYEKTNAISSEGWYMNFLVLCIKLY